MPTQYPIRAVAKLTGITVDTLRAWERRYQAVTPDRASRGRLYNEADVRRLLLLRSALEGGHAIGQVASLSDAELQHLVSAPFLVGRASHSEPLAKTDLPGLRILLDAIESFDFATINSELGRLALLLSPAGLVHKVILPLMRLTGDNWENGTYQIAQEHMFSACVRNLLGGLVRLQRPSSGAATLLLATPSNELHEFGILAAAMLAVDHDFQVAYLGPNLPAREILSAANKCTPQVVVLGIMKTNATPSVREDVARIASGLSATTELWVGGSGASDVVDGVVRSGTFVLDDLPDFEQHLTRWQVTRPRESVL
jgi:DNA-binding transcriptional MerR regulator/methylmalonyl-CoA mutase cobalamin-binding subunit